MYAYIKLHHSIYLIYIFLFHVFNCICYIKLSIYNNTSINLEKQNEIAGIVSWLIFLYRSSGVQEQMMDLKWKISENQHHKDRSHPGEQNQKLRTYEGQLSSICSPRAYMSFYTCTPITHLLWSHLSLKSSRTSHTGFSSPREKWGLWPGFAPLNKQQAPWAGSRIPKTGSHGCVTGCCFLTGPASSQQLVPCVVSRGPTAEQCAWCLHQVGPTAAVGVPAWLWLAIPLLRAPGTLWACGDREGTGDWIQGFTHARQALSYCLSYSPAFSLSVFFLSFFLSLTFSLSFFLSLLPYLLLSFNKVPHYVVQEAFKLRSICLGLSNNSDCPKAC